MLIQKKQANRITGSAISSSSIITTTFMLQNTTRHKNSGKVVLMY